MGVEPSPGHRFPVVVAVTAAQDYFQPCMESLFAQRPVDVDLFLIQQSAEAGTMVEPYADRATIHRPGWNIGTCRAWNAGLKWAFDRGYSEALILNDDMLLTDPRTLSILLDIIKVAPRQLRWIKNRGFSAICVTKAIVEEIGWFDEGYWPAYAEDNDYHYRVKLAHIPWDDVQIDSDHLGSGTIKANPLINAANAHSFDLNIRRHELKWGGRPHQETYSTPWNGGEEVPSTRDLLPPEIRRTLELHYDAPLPV